MCTSSVESEYNAVNILENEKYFYLSDYSKTEGYSVQPIKD